MKTHTMRNWRGLCEEAEAEAAPQTPRLAHQITRTLTAQLAYLKLVRPRRKAPQIQSQPDTLSTDAIAARTRPRAGNS